MSSPAIEIFGLTKDYPHGFWRKRMRRSLDNLTFKWKKEKYSGFSVQTEPEKPPR